MSQSGLSFSDAYAAALINNKTNPLYGAQGQLHYLTGSWYLPQGYGTFAQLFNTTINRCYYVPFAISEAHTFQGASTINQGTGDSGEKIRLMAFKDDGVGGGPGTLAKDFGEITLTGAAAVNTLASSWAAAPGMYWAAIWHQTVASMYSMEPFQFDSAAGFVGGMLPGHYMGTLSLAVGAGTNTYCHYVDTAYGAAPATAVTPTNSLSPVGLDGTGRVPIFALKA